MGPKIDLQLRDYLLLTRLCQFGYLNLEYITELIFETHYKNVSRRLIKLRKLGLVSFIRRTAFNGTKVYIPLIKNIQSLVTEEMWAQGQKLCTFQPWFFRLYEHSDQVRYWGLRVLKYWPDVALNLEYLLDPGDYTLYEKGLDARIKIPDFTIEFEDEDQVSFEIELHPKSSSTYDQIFLSMHQMRRWPVVYFVRTPSINN